jgi:hypothetical protein
MVHDPSQLDQGVLETPVHHVPGQTQNGGNLGDRERLWHIDAEAQQYNGAIDGRQCCLAQHHA